MTIETASPRTRRAILGAGLGALVAGVASALGRPAATRAADNDPVLLGNTNTATILAWADLFLDGRSRLWFCKGGTSWKQIA